MSGEKDFDRLLKTMKPQHNAGDYVFCVANDLTQFKMSDVLLLFKEHEANTIIIKKEIADSLNLPYTFVAAWITLMVHSSLEAVGLTAAFSTALAANNISCNVVAAFYHDHIFVDKKDIDKAMQVLNELAD
jgi:uncharacterized protein